MESVRSAEVVVIGGGIAGISAALKIATTHNVLLLERKHLFWGASGRNPGRMGHGYHYMDLQTAKMYLHASIAVQRNYPDFLIGKDLPFEHPIRHGRYYVTKDSNYSFEEVMETYRAIQQEYAALIEEDPQNQVFGPVETFLKVLAPEDYDSHINSEIVQGAVETAEHLFNWPEFAKHIQEVIAAHPRIKLLENTEVIHIEPRPSRDVRFGIETAQTQEDASVSRLKINSNFIVNSSWENIEFLNEKAGSRYINRMRTNRLKCLLEVELPESLRDVNSAFFCMGSFCMFSNMGNGRGMITLADITNMATSYAVKIDANMERYIHGDVSAEEENEIAAFIIAGAAQYMPLIAEARKTRLMFGIVQTQGELNLRDLLDPRAAHHFRNYHGIREEYQGLISNPAMKLFYFLENATMVYHFFELQQQRELNHQEVYRRLMEAAHYPWGHLFPNDLKRAIYFIIDRMMLGPTEDPRKIVNDMSRTMFLKLDFHKYISYARQTTTELFSLSPHIALRLMIKNYGRDPYFGLTIHPPAQPLREEAKVSFELYSPKPLVKTLSIYGLTATASKTLSAVALKKTRSLSFFAPINAFDVKCNPMDSDESVQTRSARPSSVDYAMFASALCCSSDSKAYGCDDSIFPLSPRN
ncbi:MAG TPA: hypothetical protein DCZ80_02625 [Legionellales bacterium]|nr:hypothetical protein [Legionellales bacterium]